MNSFLFLQTAFQSLLAELNTLVWLVCHTFHIPRTFFLTLTFLFQNFSLQGSLRSCSTEELEQFRIFANYLAVMKIIPNPALIPAELLRSTSPASTTVTSHTAVHMSALHERVVTGLSAAFEEESVSNQYQVRVEESSFGGIFPVDITIVDASEKSIEADNLP